MSDFKAVKNFPDISFIDDMTLTELKAKMRDAYITAASEVAGETVELQNASERAMELDAAAYVIYQCLLQIDQMGKMNLLKYSKDDYLDHLGAFKNTERKAEAAATVTARFSLTGTREAATSIPQGTRITAGDGILFATDSYAEISAGSLYADVGCTCTTTGTTGNGYTAGEINRFVDALHFVATVSNTTTSEGGADEETDADYRESIFEAPNGYTTGGSEESYAWLVKSFSTLIDDVSVYSPSECVIQIRYMLKGGVLPGTEMNTRLLAYINDDSRKLMSDKVSVMAPTAVNYNVTLTYYISKADMNSATEIQEKVNDAVDEYIAWQKEKIGRDINPNMLTKMVIEAGAIRCDITAPTRTVLDNFSIAIGGTPSATYGGLVDE